MSQALHDVIPIMNLFQEICKKGFKIICTEPYVYCKVFEDNSGALELARLPKIRPRTKHIYATIIFVNMYARDLLKYSILTQKTRLLMHLPKLWHKMTFNVITFICAASDLPKLPM